VNFKLILTKEDELVRFEEATRKREGLGTSSRIPVNREAKKGGRSMDKQFRSN